MATSGSNDALCAGASKAAPPSETLPSETSPLKTLPFKTLQPETLPSKISPLKTLPSKISPLEGLDVPIHQYKGIEDLRERVQTQTTEPQDGRSNQHCLFFRGVTKKHLAEIERERFSIRRHIRFTHYSDTGLLIIKMPSIKHEVSHRELADTVRDVLKGMGFPKRSLVDVGSGKYFGLRSAKEGDTGYKPRVRNREADWPTIVFDSGLSESLAQLRGDAHWWLTSSGGDVKIVVLIKIRAPQKAIVIEKWCFLPTAQIRWATRLHPHSNAPVPTRRQEITIRHNPAAQLSDVTSYRVTGAPLTLEFRCLLLRNPIPPEGDVILTAADLSLWACNFWTSVM